jgi:hypothetical protein
MRIDSIGMLTPDPPPEPVDLRYRCPDCSTPCWPTVDQHGRVAARRCVPCQVAYDLTADEVARIPTKPTGGKP